MRVTLVDDLSTPRSIFRSTQVQRVHLARIALTLLLLFWGGVHAAATVTLAAAGDTACAATEAVTDTTCQMAATAALIERVRVETGVDAVLALGDLQYPDGALADFRTGYDKNWGVYKPITFPVPGNHEYATPGAEGYFGYFGDRAGVPGKGYYSFELGAWHIVALNSSCAEIGGCGATSPQGRWLKGELAEHPAACTLAFWHHARFSSGWHGSNANFGDFWKLLEDAGAEVVLNAHDHLYERLAPQTNDAQPSPEGIRAFVVGTGGKSYYPALLPAPNREALVTGVYGVLFLTLAAEGYSWEYRTTPDGVVRDAGQGRCR